jgi:hypothetical protein
MRSHGVAPLQPHEEGKREARKLACSENLKHGFLMGGGGLFGSSETHDNHMLRVSVVAPSVRDFLPVTTKRYWQTAS